MFGPVSHPICPCGPMTIPVRPIGPPEQGFSSIDHPRFPNVVPPYLQMQSLNNTQYAQYGPVPPGMLPLPNYGCQCPKIRINDPSCRTEQCACSKDEEMQENKVQKGKSDTEYSVQLDDVKTNKRDSHRASKIDFSAPDPVLRSDDVKDKIFWLFSEDMPGPKPDDIICSVPKNRDIRHRKPTGKVKNSHKLKKNLLAKLNEASETSLNSNEMFSFAMPEGIREPKQGDMISWQGISSDGPQPGVRAIWRAEEMKDEPGKICWLGNEITDMETQSVLRHDLKSSKPNQHVWKSRTGFCLPPIASKQQKPIQILDRSNLSEYSAESSPTVASHESGPFPGYNLPKSISAYNIPSEVLKTVSWERV